MKHDNTDVFRGDAWLEDPPSLTGGRSDQKQPSFTGIDYLRITVFSSIRDTKFRVNQWLERWAPTYSDVWESAPVSGRVDFVHASGLPGLSLEEGEDFQGVRIKGQACSLLGLDAVLDLLNHLQGVRWQASRIDLAWDGFPLTTRQTFDLLKAGDYRTRARLDPHPVGDLDADPIDGKGSTVYTHCQPELNGIQRYIRFYDKRGPVRCELVMKGKYARAFVHRVYEMDTAAASVLSMGALRGFLDFTEPSQQSERPTRRDLHPQWEQFVSHAEPWRLDQAKKNIEKQGLERLGVYETAFIRSARRLYEAMQAFGPEYVVKRIEHYGQPKASLTDIESLKAIRSAAASRHMCGIPPWPESFDADVPF